MSLYDNLGIDKNATDEEVKVAYRKKAMKHHPDHSGKDDAFKDINMAYHVLIDHKKREHYDRTGDHNGPKNPNDIQQQAISALCSLFSSALQKLGSRAFEIDIIKEMKRVVNNKTGEDQGKLEKISKERAFLKKVVDHIECFNKNNYLAIIIEDQIRNMDLSKDGCLLNLKINKEMINLLSNFGWRFQQSMKIDSTGTDYAGTTVFFTAS